MFDLTKSINAFVSFTKYLYVFLYDRFAHRPLGNYIVCILIFDRLDLDQTMQAFNTDALIKMKSILF